MGSREVTASARRPAPAGLDGTWRAWLSTTTTAAIDRINGEGQWYLPDRTTLVDGGAAAETCSNWTTDHAATGLAALIGASGASWTANGAIDCGTYAFIDCFEVLRGTVNAGDAAPVRRRR